MICRCVCMCCVCVCMGVHVDACAGDHNQSMVDEDIADDMQMCVQRVCVCVLCVYVHVDDYAGDQNQSMVDKGIADDMQMEGVTVKALLSRPGRSLVPGFKGSPGVQAVLFLPAEKPGSR